MSTNSLHAVPPGLCGGIRWRSGTPELICTERDGGQEHHTPLERGTEIGLRLGGTRFCVGIRRDGARRCPYSNRIRTHSTETQCRACAATDPGRAIARDAVVDPRPFHLYLAWFGPGVLKVGITTVQRGQDRLAEQAALAFCWLASGPHEVVRAAERAIAAAGIAPERRRRATKLAALWDLPAAEDRRDELWSAYQQAIRCGGWPAELAALPFAAIDNAALFALDRLPGSVADITELRPASVLSGTAITVIGTDMVLDTAHGPTMLGGRLLAGWPVEPTGEAPSGYRTTQRGPGEHALF
ncbi:DUF2797 domain-containing protein [Haloechinothrix sp. LS1_15]|uniref:DUF2797 domain-containing protein n=1 Tax=Haloechinothrix sp. LS1_15 TaxID=2652248 RepID=UPI0029475CCC|nr:DUF2797 domain-containing protein [Haloechinothrix sp. LS1_15]MDV6011307.1 DUF2797 domain-containing protein [Haloechinothrix sp. LS1_15]